MFTAIDRALAAFFDCVAADIIDIEVCVFLSPERRESKSAGLVLFVVVFGNNTFSCVRPTTLTDDCDDDLPADRPKSVS